MNKLIWIILIIIVLLVIIYYYYSKKSSVAVASIPNSASAVANPSVATATVTAPASSSSTATSSTASSSTASTAITIYSLPNFQGTSYTLPGPGNYPLSKGCGNTSLSVLPFKPQSIVVPAGYKVQIQGYYGNPGDSTCGPSATYASNLASLFNSWMMTNTNGSLNIIAG